MSDYKVELMVDSVWQDITPDVLNSSPIVMERGRRDWASETDPATMSLRLNNGASKVATGVSGRYSPRNPMSDLFGKIGRNTQIRVRVDGDLQDHALLPGTYGSVMTTEDTLDIVGDIDVRIDIEPNTWRPELPMDLIGQYRTKGTATDEGNAWMFYLMADGTLRFRWTEDGTATNSEAATSTAAIPSTSGRLSVRVALDVSTSGNHTVKFYTAPSGIAVGDFTQLGSTVTVAGVTSIASTTEPIVIGGNQFGRPVFDGSKLFTGKVYESFVREGLSGDTAVHGLFDAQEASTRSFEDTDFEVTTWNLRGSATFHDPRVRFAGEVPAWPVEWDLSGAAQWVSVKASGITRRLQQGTKPALSTLFRDLSTKTNVAAYWPLEDPTGATRFNSGLPGDVTYLTGSPVNEVKAAASSDVFWMSAPLPTVEAGIIAGDFPTYTPEDRQAVAFLVGIPDGHTWGADTQWFKINTTGTIQSFEVWQTASDDLKIITRYFDGGGLASTSLAKPMSGFPHIIQFQMHQEGANVTWRMNWFPIEEPDSSSTWSVTLPVALTYGQVSSIELGNTAGCGGTVFGHVFLLNGDVETIWDSIYSSAIGWAGDTPMGRLSRLAYDENLPAVRMIGVDDGEPMGSQPYAPIMQLIREVPTADLGLLSDRADALGLQYRGRSNLYNQEPALVLDYSSGMISAPFRPVEDDKSVANEITLTRSRGTSLTVADTTGTLSSQDPPLGVGRYNVAQTVSLETDEQLSGGAWWRLHLGTIDEARFPELTVNLRNPRVEPLTDSILAVREGDIIRVTNTPTWIPPGPYDLFVEGFEETKSADEHVITFACSPGSAWTVGEYDSDASRYAPDSCTLAAAMDATQTSVSVNVVGSVWGDDDGSFDVTIGGERITVTEVTGAASPQTLTLVRSVNGIRKAHASGAALELYNPARYAL